MKKEKEYEIPDDAENPGRTFARITVRVAMFAVCVWAVFAFIFGIFVCRGSYMSPGVSDGDICIVFRKGDISRNDVVAYRRRGQLQFGRVIGIPGDQLDVQQNQLLVNSVPESRGYVTSHTGMPTSVSGYYVMNDSRADENDSRTQGQISRSDIVGRVVFLWRVSDF